MSTNTSRRPSAASENFVTVIAILFFVSVAVLFQWLDYRKHKERSQSKEQPALAEENQATAYYEKATAPAPTDQSFGEHMNRLLDPHGCKTEGLFSMAHSQHAVHPPIPKLDVAPQQFTVNAGTGQLFTSARKSVISIPPQAFLDKNGKVATGNVQVQYREFYNYLDFFRSGIPMYYADGNAQLESAGMFEFTASSNNQPLYSNPQSRISVMMTSLNNAVGYNLYYFNPEKKEWVDKGESSATVSSEGMQSFRRNNTVEDSVEKKFYFSYPTYRLQVNARLATTKKRSFFLSPKTKINELTFHFVASKQEVPGLNSLRNVTWRYTGSDAAKVHAGITRPDTTGGKPWVLPRAWNNVTLHPVKEDDTWLITFTDESDTVTVKVFPRLTSEKAIVRFNENMKNFLSLQENRAASQEEAFEKFQQDTISYFASNARWVKKTLTNQYAMMREVVMDGFGIWNVDRPVSIPKSIAVRAAFMDENGRQVSPIKVYLADKSVNTVFTFEPGGLNKFKFNPSASNLVWAVFPGDVIAVIRPSEFRDLYARSVNSCVFRVNLNRSAALTEKKLKEQLVFDI